MRRFFLTKSIVTPIKTSARIPPATPSPTASFCLSDVGSGSMGSDPGVSVVTEAKRVYAEVGSAGPGETVGYGAREMVWVEKNERTETSGYAQVLLV